MWGSHKWSQHLDLVAWRSRLSCPWELESMCALLDHLSEAVGDAEGRVDEALHTAHKTRLCPRIQLPTRLVHTFIPTYIREVVNLQTGWTYRQRCRRGAQCKWLILDLPALETELSAARQQWAAEAPRFQTNRPTACQSWSSNQS